MKFLKLHLVNIKIHDDITIDLNGETTMILGNNGSGKSTIVESIYYALFRTLLVPNVECMISDKIKKTDADGKVSYLAQAYIELFIEHQGTNYSIKSGLAKSTSSLKVLENDTWIEKSNKITDMYLFIKNTILEGMTPEYFINTVYTEQMGILKLVDKSEAPRQQEFDKLIGIDRFQKIHAGIANSFTLLNKMKRNDIDKVIDSRIEKSSKLDGLKLKEQELDVERLSLSDRKNLILSVYQSKSDGLKALENEYDVLYTMYNEANALTSKLVEYKKLSESTELELKELESKTSITDLETEHDNLTSELGLAYDTICEKVAEVFNDIDRQTKKLVVQIDALNADIKTHEYIKFHSGVLKEANEKLLGLEKSEKDNSDKLAKEEASLISMDADVKKLNDAIHSLSGQVTNLETSQFEILKKYNNENYDYEVVKASILSDGDTDSIFTQDTYLCIYCESSISKEKMTEKFKQDKKNYHSLFDKIVKLQEDINTKESTLSAITLERQRWIQDIAKIKSDIQYSQMVKADAIKKVQTSKVEIQTLENKLSATKTLPELNVELDSCKRNLDQLNKNESLKPLYAYKGVSQTKASKEHDIKILIDEVREYHVSLTRSQTLEKSINTFKEKHKNISDTLLKYKSSLADMYPKFQEKLSKSKSSDMKDFYEKVKALQESLNAKKVEVGNMLSELSNIDKLIDSNRNFHATISKDIDYLVTELRVIEATIANDVIIETRLKMVNVAKMYFKQDGLAKHIRKYYIDKINENMTNYISLFGFDFTPKLDETAGIEGYFKYSGGQKIAIAILVKMILNFILKNPINVMILDEPTPYMDTERIEAIKELVESIKNKLQVIVITHDTEFMTIDCNKVIFGEGATQ